MNKTWTFAVVCLLAVSGLAWAAPGAAPGAAPAPAAAAAPVTPATLPAAAPALAPASPAPAAPTTRPVDVATTAPAPVPVPPPASSPAPAPSPAATAPAATGPAPATKIAEPPKPAPKKLDAFVHGKNIAALPDQEIILDLKGATDTPWTLAKVEGDSLQQVGKVEFKPKKEGDKEGTYTTTFKAAKEGKSTVLLEGTMVMEGGKKQKMEVKFSVTVAAGT